MTWWDELTDEQRRQYEKQGWAPQPRDDRTAEDMRPVYEARGFKRTPPAVRGHWDDYTDEQYARWFRHFTPEQLVGSLRARGLDIVCTDPDTLAAVAKIDVAYQRQRARERAAEREEH